MNDLTDTTDTTETTVPGETAENSETEAVTPPGPVEVRRNGVLAAVVGSLATLVAVAYLARAATSGSLVDWLVFLALGALAIAQGAALRDARTPLLVADRTGIRLRLGRTWHGLPWEELEEVEHAPRRSLLRDGRLVAFPTDGEAALAALDPMARRQAAIAQRVHGAPFAVPLGLTTVVTGADDGLTAALLALAPDPELVVEVVPAEPEVASELWEQEEPTPDDETQRETTDLDDGAYDVEVEKLDDSSDTRDTRGAEDVGDTRARPNPFRRLRRAAGTDADPDPDGVEDTAERPLLPTRTPSPLRDPVTAVRSDVTRAVRTAPRGGRELVSGSNALATDPSQARLAELPEADELRRVAPDYVEHGSKDTALWSSTTVVTVPVAATGTAPAQAAMTSEVADEASVIEPVIGPQLAAARRALGLGVDQLAERTRIRAHVIDAVEIDDFAPCGGDFYARGHLRTLARVLGLDAAPLLATYDEKYADAPIDARRVFEAELSTGAGGSIRSLRGGPNWSVIVAAVMAVVLAWSIARLVMDQPQGSASNGPSLSSGSAGLTSGSTDLAPPVPVVLTAEGGGAKVVVRDGAGKVLFKGNLAFGQSRTVKAAPPVRVQTSDGSLTVSIDGQDPKPMGRTGEDARDTFVP